MGYKNYCFGLRGSDSSWNANLPKKPFFGNEIGSGENETVFCYWVSALDFKRISWCAYKRERERERVAEGGREKVLWTVGSAGFAGLVVLVSGQ